MVMSDRDFMRFREMIYGQCGINLSPVKKIMLTSRLRKRMRILGMTSFAAYYEYVADDGGQGGEMIRMLDAVSTNKTDFFRESAHFDYLKNQALPELVRLGRWRPGSKLNVWSAGCSSGQEPYTIAMVLAKFAAENRVGTFSILATDISTRVLEAAINGIYTEDVTAPVPQDLRRKYLMRGKGSQKGLCRIVPELREHVQFRRLNLNEGRDFGIRTRMDIIFCRNVIIYFDRDTQRVLFNKYYNQLHPGGYLFIGHSESLHGINDRFKGVDSATYVKPL
jgi:chemotaxis protein methyltransferase CheR